MYIPATIKLIECLLSMVPVQQDYKFFIFQKISKKFHLSKSRLSSLNESGQLVVFHLLTLLWGGDAIIREGFVFNISQLWEGNYILSSLHKLPSWQKMHILLYNSLVNLSPELEMVFQISR